MDDKPKTITTKEKEIRGKNNIPKTTGVTSTLCDICPKSKSFQNFGPDDNIPLPFLFSRVRHAVGVPDMQTGIMTSRARL